MNPILLVTNGGRGVTPVPADALLQPGDTMNIQTPGADDRSATVIAVVPPRTPIEYAIADQRGEPRPLMFRDNRKSQNLYVLEVDGQEVIVPHDKMARGLKRAEAA